METPYKALHFVQHDIMTRDKMDQLQSNLQWIKDNTPRGRLYRANNVLLDTTLVMIAGKKEINRDRKHSSRTASVKFGRAFAPTCVPNVTTGTVCDWTTALFVVVNGPKGKNQPDATGFELSVAVADNPTTKKEEVIKKPFWVHWSAFGFRTDDMNVF